LKTFYTEENVLCKTVLRGRWGVYFGYRSGGGCGVQNRQECAKEKRSRRLNHKLLRGGHVPTCRPAVRHVN